MYIETLIDFVLKWNDGLTKWFYKDVKKLLLEDKVNFNWEDVLKMLQHVYRHSWEQHKNLVSWSLKPSSKT